MSLNDTHKQRKVGEEALDAEENVEISPIVYVNLACGVNAC